MVELRRAMDNVFERNNVNELMKDERWTKIKELVAPHFEKIGRPLKYTERK